MNRRVFIITLCTAAIISLGFYWYSRTMREAPPSPAAQNQLTKEHSPDNPSRPYEDLTIPFLRKRAYTSVIGELKQPEDKGLYTSYLTSYDSDGLTINALLTLPKGDPPVKGWPAVVFVHGYIPPSIYDTKTRYAAYVDTIAQKGIVVFKIDLRGHGTSEGEATGGYFSSGYVIDTLNAYRALEKDPRVDPQRIGLWGHSMAGNVVLRAAMVEQTVPTVVIWAGAVYTYLDLQQYGIQDTSYRPPPSQSPTRRRRQELYDAVGEITEENTFWQSVAPTNFLNDFSGTIELHHALDDAVVSIEYSRNLNRLLDQTVVPHTLYEYSSGGHNISGTSFNQAMERTTQALLAP